MKLDPYKISKFLLNLLLGWVALTFIFLFFSMGMMVDFPCSSGHESMDENGACFLSSHYSEREKSFLSNASFEVSVTTFYAGASGGGCFHKISDSNTIAGMGVTFERDGDVVKIDGRSLAAGEGFKGTDYFGVDPWTIRRYEFKNLGVLRDCRGSLNQSVGNARLIVDGTSGSEISLLKGLLMLVILLLARSAVKRKIKQRQLTLGA